MRGGAAEIRSRGRGSFLAADFRGLSFWGCIGRCFCPSRACQCPISGLDTGIAPAGYDIAIAVHNYPSTAAARVSLRTPAKKRSA